MHVSVYVLVYRYMHSCIFFIKVKVMFSVKAQWITRLDSNFLSKIVRPAAQSRSAGMYTCLNHLIVYGVQFVLHNAKFKQCEVKGGKFFDGYMSVGSK